MHYTNYTNLDARFSRHYVPGDRLVRGYTGTIDTDMLAIMDAAERVYARHNRDDRPDGQMCPSMSVGDVIVFGHELAVSVDAFGFITVDLDPKDLITDKTWLEVVR